MISMAVFLPLLLTFCKISTENISSFEKINSPEDNPLSTEKIALGRRLFFDKRLSRNETVSCATCHKPEFAFTDRLKVSKGVDGRLTERNSPSILNSAYLKTVMFDAHLTSLELQVIVPIQEHNEMDLTMIKALERLKKVDEYNLAAKRIFNREFDAYVLTRSIAAFERSLISDNSRFDKYLKGNKKALTKNELEGYRIFTDKLYCTKCHPAPYFTNFVAKNNGLYKEFGTDKGRFRIFNDTSDIGKFKVPSLRNIELSYPYMHDGSKASLDDVIDHYAKGGEGHTLQDKEISSFSISNKEKLQLIAFLKSLTDTSYMKNFR